MITTKDDGWVYTHDDALSLLKAHAPGCEVHLYKIRDAREQTRAFQIVVNRLGKQLFSPGDAYALPFNAFVMGRHVKETLQKNFGR